MADDNVAEDLIHLPMVTSLLADKYWIICM